MDFWMDMIDCVLCLMVCMYIHTFMFLCLPAYVVV